jgi:uncharacterized protein with HEPN domain
VKSDLPYLAHIADSIAAIETYIVGGRDVFMRERLVQDAVARNFEIIGEAASRLSSRVRDRLQIGKQILIEDPSGNPIELFEPFPSR